MKKKTINYFKREKNTRTTKYLFAEADSRTANILKVLR